MRSIWIIARQEYLVTIRRPGFVIMTALIPSLGLIALLIATLFGGQAGTFLERQFTGNQKPVGIVDQAGPFGSIPAGYQDALRLYPDEAAGEIALRKGDIGAMVIVPSDYLASGSVTIVTNDSGVGGAMLEESDLLREFLVSQLLRDRVNPDVVVRAVNPFNPTFRSLGGNTNGASGGANFAINMLVPYFMALLLIITIFTASGYLLRSVTEEKTNRVIEVILSSVTAKELLAGKVLGQGAAGLTQMLVWLGAFVGLSGGIVVLLGVSMPLLARPEVFFLAPVYYLLGFLVYAVLMGAAGALGTTTQESQQLAGVFSFMASIPFMAAGLIFTNPNATVARVLSWIPFTSPTMMLLRLPMADVPVIDIVGSIALLAITIPVLVWAGAKVFRMGLLMYGKRASMKQVWHALRQA